MSVVMVTTPGQALKKKIKIRYLNYKIYLQNKVNQPKFLISRVSVDVLESYNYAPHFYASHKAP